MTPRQFRLAFLLSGRVAFLRRRCLSRFSRLQQDEYLLNFAVGYSSGAEFATEGWWSVTPNTCATPIKGPLKGRYVYLYAIDIDANDVLKGLRVDVHRPPQIPDLRHCRLLAARPAGGEFRRGRHIVLARLDGISERSEQMIAAVVGFGSPLGLTPGFRSAQRVFGQEILQQGQEVARRQSFRPIQQSRARGSTARPCANARRRRRSASAPPRAKGPASASLVVRRLARPRWPRCC